MSTHIVIPDAHAHPGFDNKRAHYAGRLIARVKPDVVVNIGDCADMPSLSSYDQGTKGFQGRRYAKDIACTVDFNDRLWYEVRRQKQKLPRRVILIGNHEERITKAVNSQPELLEGVIDMSDLQYEQYYDEVIPYTGGTPGIVQIDGVNYAHYFANRGTGRAISSINQAPMLLNKLKETSTQGHDHLFSQAIQTTTSGRKIHGLSVGIFQDYWAEWAGTSNHHWDRGIVIKRNVTEGRYDLEWIGIDSLKKEFS